MTDQTSDPDALLAETAALRRRVAELEAREADRRQALDAAPASEGRLTELLDGLPDLAFRWNVESGSLDYANASWERVLGYSPDDVLQMGDGFMETLLDADDGERVAEATRHLMAGAADGPGHDVIELRLRHRNGRKLWFRVARRLVVDSAGRAVAIVGTAQDVTAQRAIQEALRESRARYQSLFDNCPIPLYEQDFTEAVAYVRESCGPDCADVAQYLVEHPDVLRECVSRIVVLDASQLGLLLLGARSKDQLRAGLQDIFGEEAYPEFARAIAALMTGALPFRCDAVVRSLSGETRPVWLRLDVAPSPERGPYHVLIALGDISRREQAVTELQRSEETARALLNATSDIAVLLDPEGTILALNGPAAAGLGASVDDLIGKCAYDYVDEGTARRRRANNDEVVRSGGPLHVEEEHRGRSLDVHLYPVADQAGDVYAVAAFAADVTEMKEAAAALARSEREFSVLCEYLPSGLLVFDYRPPGEFLLRSANIAAVRELGLVLDDDVGKAIQEVWIGTDADDMIDPFVELMETAEPFRGYAFRHDEENGRRAYSYWCFRSAPNRLGVGFSEVTSETEAADRLATSERTARVLLGGPTDLAMLIDCDGRILDINDTGAERYGGQRDELMGTCVYDLFPPDLAAIRRARADAVVHSGAPARYQDELDGGFYDTVIDPIRDARGGVTRLAVRTRDITDLRRAEQQLIEAERLHTEIVQAIPSGLLVYDYGPPDLFTLVDANPEATRLTGARMPQDRGKPFRELWPGSFDDGITRAYVDVMQSGEPVQREAVYSDLEGSITRVFDARIFRLSEQRLGVAFDDITERVQAQAELDLTQRTSAEIVAVLPLGLVVFEYEPPDMFILMEANPEAERLAGISMDAQGGRLLRDVWPEANRKDPVDAFVRAMETGETLDREWVQWDERGHESLTLKARIFRMPEGRLGVAFEDVTSRHEAARRLNESEERFRAIVEASPIGLATADLANGVLWANPAFCDMLGYEEEELVGMSVDEITHPDDRTRSTELNAGIFDGTRRAYRIEKRYVRKDGSTLWAELTGVAVHGSDGTPSHGLAMVQDVSARREADLARVGYGRNLQRLAAELVNAEERERRRFADNLHDGVGQLLSVAAMQLGVVPQGQLSKDGRGRLTAASNLLDQAIQATRNLTLELSPPALYQLGLRQALQELAGELARREGLQVLLRGSWRHAVAPEEVRVALYRAARELLHNVVKHAKVDRAVVKLDEDDGSFCLTVSDEGQGSDLEGGLGDRETSEGFGLFSIRERIESLGGKVKVASRPGAGTSVTLSVPIPSPDTPSEN